jgi:hypothetical protein
MTQWPKLGVVAGHARIVVDRSDPRNSGIVTCEPNQLAVGFMNAIRGFLYRISRKTAFPAVDDLFIAFGTTIKLAAFEAAFRQVDLISW